MDHSRPDSDLPQQAMKPVKRDVSRSAPTSRASDAGRADSLLDTLLASLARAVAAKMVATYIDEKGEN